MADIEKGHGGRSQRRGPGCWFRGDCSTRSFSENVHERDFPAVGTLPCASARYREEQNRSRKMPFPNRHSREPTGPASEPASGGPEANCVSRATTAAARGFFEKSEWSSRDRSVVEHFLGYDIDKTQLEWIALLGLLPLLQPAAMFVRVQDRGERFIDPIDFRESTCHVPHPPA